MLRAHDGYDVGCHKHRDRCGERYCFQVDGVSSDGLLLAASRKGASRWGVRCCESMHVDMCCDLLQEHVPCSAAQHSAQSLQLLLFLLAALGFRLLALLVIPPAVDACVA